MTRHRRRSSRSPMAWARSSNGSSRTRCRSACASRSIAAGMANCHVRTSTTALTGSTLFPALCPKPVCSSGFARTCSPAATGEGCTSRRSRQAVSDQDDEVLPLPVSSHCMSCWSHCSAMRPCVRRFHSPCARWQCACLNRSSRRLRRNRARKTATIDTESAPTPPSVVAVPKRAEAPASFAVPAQAAPVSAPSTPAPAAVPAPVTAARFDADYLQNQDLFTRPCRDVLAKRAKWSCASGSARRDSRSPSRSASRAAMPASTTRHGLLSSAGASCRHARAMKPSIRRCWCPEFHLEQLKKGSYS